MMRFFSSIFLGMRESTCARSQNYWLETSSMPYLSFLEDSLGEYDTQEIYSQNSQSSEENDRFPGAHLRDEALSVGGELVGHLFDYHVEYILEPGLRLARFRNFTDIFYVWFPAVTVEEQGFVERKARGDEALHCPNVGGLGIHKKVVHVVFDAFHNLDCVGRSNPNTLLIRASVHTLPL